MTAVCAFYSPVFLGIESQMTEKVLQLFGIVLLSAARRRFLLVSRHRQQTQQIGRPVTDVRLAAQYRSAAADLVGHRRRGHDGRRPRWRRGRRWRQRRWWLATATVGRRVQTPALAAARHGRFDGRRGRTRRNAAATVSFVFRFHRTAGRLAVRLFCERMENNN